MTFEAVVSQHGATVWRVCRMYCPQKADAEDAFQQTFVKYATAKPEVADEEHRKAWLIRVATNTCKDMLRAMSRHADPVPDYEAAEQGGAAFVASGLDGPPEDPAGQSPVREALGTLPEEYRVPLYLMYFEGCSAVEIATMIDVPVNTVYTRLSRGRQRLKEILQNDQ